MKPSFYLSNTKPHRWSEPTARWLLLVTLCPLLAGCLVIPIPKSGEEVMYGQAVPEPKVLSVDLGRTTREEIMCEFGTPKVIWVDQRVFAYEWDAKSMEVFWLLWGVDAGVVDVPRHLVLLVQFDDQGIVTRLGKTARRQGRHYAETLVQWVTPNGAATDRIRVRPPADCLRPVLFHVEAMGEGKPVGEATRHWLVGDRALFGPSTLAAGLGTFESGGHPQKVKPLKLTRQSAEQGWYYLMVPVGTNYLYLGTGTCRAETAKPLYYAYDLVCAIYVPARAQAVYAGSLTFDCSLQTKYGTTYGWRILTHTCQITDERAQAERLFAEWPRRPGLFITSLMVPHEGPPLLWTPEWVIIPPAD